MSGQVPGQSRAARDSIHQDLPLAVIAATDILISDTPLPFVGDADTGADESFSAFTADGSGVTHSAGFIVILANGVKAFVIVTSQNPCRSKGGLIGRLSNISLYFFASIRSSTGFSIG